VLPMPVGVERVHEAERMLTERYEMTCKFRKVGNLKGRNGVT
jgi:hypothetical protein